MRLRTAPDDGDGSLVAAAVSRVGVPTGPTLWQFAVAPSPSGCNWRTLAGFENNADGVLPSEYSSARPLPPVLAAYIAPGAASHATTRWTTSWCVAGEHGCGCVSYGFRMSLPLCVCASTLQKVDCRSIPTPSAPS